MTGLGSKGLIAAVTAMPCLATAPPAGAVTCDGIARAGASGAPELLTGCGRDDPGLGAGSLAATTLETPAKRTAKRRARFAFGAGCQERGERFECALDDTPFKACTSPAKVRVRPGRHEFAVRAIDAAGNRDASPARYPWTRKR